MLLTCKRRPNLPLVFVCFILYYGSLYFITDACLLFVFVLVFQYLAERLGGKNVFVMTYFESGVSYNGINLTKSINLKVIKLVIKVL